MYSAKPTGINIKDSDYDVEDGFLKESINMQYRDGALRPIPERLISGINVAGYYDIIFHKVSDEGQINVLAFKSGTPNINLLYWIGAIVNGVYTPATPTQIAVTRTAGMSFVILNGMIYFMGNGSSASEQYYVRLQFSDITSAYELKDMYAWKSLIPFYPYQSAINVTCPANTVNVFSQCGMVLIRTTLSLKSGEEVLHSPIYLFALYGINRSDVPTIKGAIIENIHTFVNLDFSFADLGLFEDEISAINIYATTPLYELSLTQTYSGDEETPSLIDGTTAWGNITQKAEEPFYLIKTINAPTTDKILLTVGPLDSDITFSPTVTKLDISTIAAGEVMPVDNFTYHKLYGKITAYNGRLTVDSPITVLGEGHLRALATEENESSNAAFRIDTEDGKVDGISYAIDKALSFSGAVVISRGILSYPDARATEVGGSAFVEGAITNLSINAGGDDYLVDDVITISGGDSNATVKATAIIGKIMALQVVDAGTGYAEGEIITVSGGGADATIQVDVVGVDGAVTGWTILSDGTGYVLDTDVATTSDGSGVDFAINITTVKGAITTYTTETKGTGYSVATGVATTVSPAGGAGFKLNIHSIADSVVRMVKLKKNALHNLACAFDVSGAGFGGHVANALAGDLITTTNYNGYINYDSNNYTEITNPSIVSAKYSSNNRLQLSEVGEFSVWPAKNSYRIGKGKIMAVGANSVNPGANLTLAPLVVGTTDGVYTGNLDPTGNLLFTSFTQNAHIPYLSKETIQIEGQLIFVSDKGLMAYNDGNPVSFTDKFFPLQGDGGFPSNNTVLPNYNVITNDYFGGSGNPYTMIDVVAYLKDALLAYDARREVIWCSNPSKTFSLLFDVKNGLWGMSLFVFSSKSEYFSVIGTSYGDIFTRFMVRKTGENYLRILSGEDMNTEVVFHILTRPIKMGAPDSYKKIVRAASRCEILRKNTNTGYVTFGMWGKNDSSKSKVNIPLIAIADGSTASFPDNVRQNIMVGTKKGKYKFITILQGGKALPESNINKFDMVAELVDDKVLR